VDLSAVAETIAIDLRRANPERQVEFAIAPGLLINADNLNEPPKLVLRAASDS
jgi:hypothetical protein